MRDGGAHDNGPRPGIDCSASLGGRMDMALADDGQVGELGRGLAQQRQIRALIEVSIAGLLCESVVETRSKPSSTA